MLDDIDGDKECLLPADGPPRSSAHRRWRSPDWRAVALICLAVFLLIANVHLIVQNAELRQAKHTTVSRFSNIAQDTPMTYHFFTDFSNENSTLSDEFWDEINLDSSMIALSDEWALAKGLTISESRFPWNHRKGLYVVKVFHQLHCLKIMRRALVDFERGNTPVIKSRHLHHCLDSLRQDLSCYADDTPMPTINKEGALGDNQVRMCRNMDHLVAWTQDLERNACYRRLSDYRWVYRKMERYAFCPEDSKYKQASDAYFRKHGHHDPYEPLPESL